MDLPGGGFCGFGCFSGLCVWFAQLVYVGSNSVGLAVWIFVGGFVELR